MWLSGRRAERPDRQYYRDVRRMRLRGPRGRRASATGAVAAAVLLVLFLLAWWVFAT